MTLDRSRSSLQLSLSSELLGSLSSTLNLLELLSVVLWQLLVAPTVSQIVLGCFSILSEVPVQIQPHLSLFGTAASYFGHSDTYFGRFLYISAYIGRIFIVSADT